MAADELFQFPQFVTRAYNMIIEAFSKDDKFTEEVKNLKKYLR